MIHLLALSTALADPPPETRAESTHDRWTSMKDLSIESSLARPLDTPLTLKLGPEVLELSGGVLVPVFSGHLKGEWDRQGDRWLKEQVAGEVPRLPTADERGDQAIVGWVWAGGTGTVTVPLDDRSDALVLANRMVMDLHEDSATWTAVAHRTAPLTSHVDTAVILGVDPEIAHAYVGDNELDPYTVVVFDTTGTSVQKAVAALRSRQAVWDAVELDVGGRVAWDRIAQERGVDALGAFSIWDLSTTQRWGLVAPLAGGDADRWLTVQRDRTGESDPRRLIRVSAMGIAPGGGFGVDGLIGGVPNPPSVPNDPTSVPLPTVRIEPVSADSQVRVTPSRTGIDLDVRVESTLTFRAIGGAAAWIDLDFPKVDKVHGSFEFVTVELEDGTPLLGRAEEDVAGFDRAPPPPEPKPPTPEPPDLQPDPTAPPEPEPFPEPGEARIRLQLPTPLAAGESIVIHAVHVDTWPYAHFAEGPLGQISNGVSSGMQGWLPSVAAQPFGSPWRYHARVGVPAVSALVTAAAGRTLTERDESGWRLVEVDSEDHVAYWPAVSVGRYESVDDPAQLGFPRVRVHAFDTHFGTIDQFGPEARRVVRFYQGYLPPFPVREIEVFEAPAQFGGYVWIAPYGMVNIQTMIDTRTTGGMDSHLESATFAHELAHQYWGQLAPPATMEDFWISESMSELFSCLYVAAAFKAEDCLGRMAGKQAEWEQKVARNASLTAAYTNGNTSDVVYDYGPYVLGQMLIRRIGPQAFFGSVDVMLREHAWEPLTTERLQAYLEAASGRDLDDFFTFWIHGGRVPALALEWTNDGKHVSGTVRSDVPFGTFDVPVVVEAGEVSKVMFVNVIDGTGTFTVPAPPLKPRVLLDPEGYVLARSRVVRRAP